MAMFMPRELTRRPSAAGRSPPKARDGYRLPTRAGPPGSEKLGLGFTYGTRQIRAPFLSHPDWHRRADFLGSLRRWCNVSRICDT